MKKIIGFLVVVLIAGAMFFNNNIKEENTTNLASLLTVGVANAEEAHFCSYTGYGFDVCNYSGRSITGCRNGGSGCGYFGR